MVSRTSYDNDEIGTLTLVSTPIGNLGDFSPRAVETLRAADLVLAEDTRSFKLLASQFNVSVQVYSFHDHNEERSVSNTISMLRDGKNIALVSEAGTPTISDPGYRLVRACREQGIPVTAVPGPNAAIMALSISGFETDRFLFAGFLPRVKGKKRRTLTELMELTAPIIIYESPFRVLDTLQAINEVDPTREVFLARELTKKFEECVTGTSSSLLEAFQDGGKLKGEFVIIVRGLARRCSKHEDNDE